MAADKENVLTKFRSKIPVPIDKRFVNEDIKETRDPLKTLTAQCVNHENPGPSHGLKLDTRHVTRRVDDEVLDWDYKVFRDHIHSKPMKDAFKKEMKTEKVEKNKPIMSAFTPLTSPTAAGSGRKVKKSLKRPHSRGLQGLTPANAKRKSSESAATLSVFSADNETFIYFVKEYVADNLCYLLRKEQRGAGVVKIRQVSRSCVVNWIINVNGKTGNPAVVQLACWYLDSYLTHSWVPMERLQLLAAGCFWIASKFLQVPASGTRLVRWAGHAFTVAKLVEAEATVLQKLKFPAQPTVPHDLVPYLSWWCEERDPGELEAAASFLCLTALLVDKNLREEYPSVVAAAAVHAGLVMMGKEGQVEKLKTCSVYQIASSKSSNISAVCTRLRNALRAMTSSKYEHKASLVRYPIVGARLVDAVNSEEMLRLDNRTKKTARVNEYF